MRAWRSGEHMSQDRNFKGLFPPSIGPLESLAFMAAEAMIYVDRAAAHVVKWRPRWYTRVLARAAGRHARLETRLEDWRRGTP